jgi:glycosyltransferase involved in cell wall biosynthesis
MNNSYNKLILIGIFKNESHILEEWIQHYLIMGVEKILLIDNGSTDRYQDILQKYIDGQRVVLVVDDKKWAQEELYNKHFLHLCSSSEWVMVADLDEFIYARNGFSKITSYLDTIKDTNIAAVKIPWKIFGSSGHKKQPWSVILGFTKRTDTGCEDSLVGSKTIARGPYIARLSHHQPAIHPAHRWITSDNQEHHEEKWGAVNVCEERLAKSCLHLNHYMIQSHDWFMKVKATRGSAIRLMPEDLRTEDYFKRLDRNEMEDTELKQIVLGTTDNLDVGGRK